MNNGNKFIELRNSSIILTIIALVVFLAHSQRSSAAGFDGGRGVVVSCDVDSCDVNSCGVNAYDVASGDFVSCGTDVAAADFAVDCVSATSGVAMQDSVLLRKLTYDMEVFFRLDRVELDGSYLGNEVTFSRFYEKVQEIGWDRVDSIEVVSYASPEGDYEHNMWLSRERSQAMKQYINKEYPELSSRLTVYSGGESWALLGELVATDTVLSADDVAAVLSVIDADIDVAEKKLRMEQLPYYQYLLDTYYPVIRKSMLCVVYFHESRIAGHLVAVPARVSTPEAVKSEPLRVSLPMSDWRGHLYVKTNLAAWGLAISNLAVEVDLAPHWSAALPVYYSAWNYVKETTKFRTLALQPEARYWLRRDNVGFYVGGHLSMAYYNFAFGGDVRYQDHDGSSPAWGGGLNVGYRLPISGNNRWHVEFNLGAGVHSLHYDTFHNTPATKDGRLIDTHRDTYWGIDQVGITFSYRFDLFKKGGRR